MFPRQGILLYVAKEKSLFGQISIN